MHLSISTGMTIEQVREQFDLPRLTAFTSYTKRFPPVHVLVASYFGFGKPTESATNEGHEEFLSTLPMHSQ